MNGRIVFLLEEPSMRELLDGLLPRLFPGLAYQCVTHEGKSDLDRSVRRKLAAWHEPGIRFIIVRDNDNADCRIVKQHLIAQCAEAGRSDTLVRLVCQELEGWYLGDLAALALAYPDTAVNTIRNSQRFLDPDVRQKPSDDLKRMVPAFQKLDGARRMAKHLAPDNNRSHSFQVFWEGVMRIAREQGYSGGA